MTKNPLSSEVIKEFYVKAMNMKFTSEQQIIPKNLLHIVVAEQIDSTYRTACESFAHYHGLNVVTEIATPSELQKADLIFVPRFNASPFDVAKYHGDLSDIIKSSKTWFLYTPNNKLAPKHTYKFYDLARR